MMCLGLTWVMGSLPWGELVATVREGRIVVLRARTGAQVGSVAINGCCGKAYELEPTGIRMALASRTHAICHGRRTRRVKDLAQPGVTSPA